MLGWVWRGPGSRGGRAPPGAVGLRHTCLRLCRGRGDSSRFGWFPSRVLGLYRARSALVGSPLPPCPRWDSADRPPCPGAAALGEL